MEGAGTSKKRSRKTVFPHIPLEVDDARAVGLAFVVTTVNSPSRKEPLLETSGCIQTTHDM